MLREFLMLVQESAYKTPATAVVWPTGSATAFYIRMDGSNAFTMRPRPVMVTVPYGGGLAVDAFRVADKLECKGKLTTKLYAGPLSEFLLGWAAKQINTGQTSPGQRLRLLATWPVWRSTTRSKGWTARSSGASISAARSTRGTWTSPRIRRSRPSRSTSREARRRATSSMRRTIPTRACSPPPPMPRCRPRARPAPTCSRTRRAAC